MNKPVVSEGVAALQGQQAQGTSKFGREIDEEANGYFQRIYGNPDNGNSNYLPVDEVLSSKNIHISPTKPCVLLAFVSRGRAIIGVVVAGRRLRC